MELNSRQKRELLQLGGVVLLLVLTFQGVDYVQRDMLGGPAQAGSAQMQPPEAESSNESTSEKTASGESSAPRMPPMAQAAGGETEKLLPGESGDVAIRVNGREITVGDIRTNLRLSAMQGGGDAREGERLPVAASKEIFQILAVQEARERGVLPGEDQIQSRVDEKMQAAGDRLLQMKGSITGSEMTEEKLRGRLASKIRRDQAVARLKEELYPVDSFSESEVQDLKQRTEEKFGDRLERDIDPEQIRYFLQDRRFGQWYRNEVLPRSEIQVVHPDLAPHESYLKGRQPDPEGGSSESGASAQ